VSNRGSRDERKGVLSVPRVFDEHALLEGPSLIVVRGREGAADLLGDRIDLFDQGDPRDDPLTRAVQQAAQPGGGEDTCRKKTKKEE
jgi:hypothetical protein